MGVMFLLMLLGAGAAGVWFLRVRLPEWRDSHDWYEPRGAVGRVAHLVAAFFVSVWFAGAVLVRTAAGRGLVCALFVWLIIDSFLQPLGPDRVAPPLIGWGLFAVLACLYGYLELRNQRAWESKVLTAHSAMKGQYRSEDVPVRFVGRYTGGMDYAFGVPAKVSRKDLFEIEEYLRQRVPTHRPDVLAAVAKRLPRAKGKTLRLAREGQDEQRGRTWRYVWDLEEHRAFAEVVSGVPEMAEHPLAASTGESFRRGDPARVPLGLSVDGEEYWEVGDLYGAGFLAVGQSRGGKSAAMRTIALHALAHPEHWDVVMVDPKVVEFSEWRGYPQVRRVATELDDMEGALREAVGEMDRRYVDLSKGGVQKIAELNAKLSAAGQRPKKRLMVVVDEVLELLEESGGRDAESKAEDDFRRACKRHLNSLVRKGAAAGVHTVLGAQRPDASVMGGQIKNNVQARLAMGGMTPEGSQMALGSNAATELPGVRGRGVFFESGRLKQVQVYWTSMELVRRVVGVGVKDAPDDDGGAK